MHQKRKLLLHPGKTHINQQIYNIFYHAFHCVANFSLVFNFVEYLADLVTEEINLVSRMKFWVGAYCHKRPWKASLFPIGFYEILWPHLFLGCWSLRGKCADLDLREWRYLDVRKWFYLDTLFNIKLNELDPFLQAVKWSRLPTGRKPRCSRIGFFNAIFSRKKVFCFLFQAPKAGRQHMGLFKGWIAMEKLIEIQETELEWSVHRLQNLHTVVWPPA